MKKVLVLGASRFIGHHIVNRLKAEGYRVRGVDLKNPEFSTTLADDFVIDDLRQYKLTYMVSKIAGKKLVKKHDTSKPQGVRGRNSDNKLIQEKLSWTPNYPLKKGLDHTYIWTEQQVKKF